ncbi:hypothetical protein D3C71_2083570 [compost metagenome]
MWIEANIWLALPPGKSQRAVPTSGMNIVSPTRITSLPIRYAMSAGVWPGTCSAVALMLPMWKVSSGANR